MNNKIIGFTITRDPIPHDDVDIFQVGLSQMEIAHAGCTIYLWGIGNLRSCFLDDKMISLSFPLHDSLLDRNVIIRLEQDGITIENDWLGSIPVFYNTKAKIASTLFLKASTNSLFSAEGFNNYLDFGYSALGLTPLEDIRLLRYFSTIVIRAHGITVAEKQDDLPEQWGTETKTEDAIRATTSYVQSNEKKVHGNIILPTSGGFDSRFLNILLGDRSRIRSYTYGISAKQEESVETVKAKEVSAALGTKWKMVPLGLFNRYWKEWFGLFGCSTHLHGMYHIEFYRHIAQEQSGPATVLSGIIGDAWSGNVHIPPLQGPQDVRLLAYTHGMNFSSHYSAFGTQTGAVGKFFAGESQRLRDEKWRVIASMRFKITLLSYLMSIPDYLGLPAWTPFLNREIALRMLFLPEKERAGRKWQREFFGRHGLDLESMPLSYSKENILNLYALQTHPIEPLDTDILAPFISKRALERINKGYGRLALKKDGTHTLRHRIRNTRYIAGLLRRLRLHRNLLEPLNNFLTLKPLETILEKYAGTSQEK